MMIKEKLLAFLARNKKTWSALLLFAGCAAVLVGGFRLLIYTVPMHSGDYIEASRSPMGDTTLALYDAGLALYQEHNYSGAMSALAKGYSQINDADGRVPPDKQQLAADFQLLIGNCLFYQEKVPQAAEAYKQALRHNPDDLAAKYNLELINLNQSGGGKGGPPKVPGGAGGKGNNKGI